MRKTATETKRTQEARPHGIIDPPFRPCSLGPSTHLLSLRTPSSDLHGRRDLGSCFIHSALSKTEPFNIEGPRLQF